MKPGPNHLRRPFRGALSRVPLLLFALTGCDDPTAPRTGAGAADPASIVISSSVIAWMQGAGTLGDGQPGGDGIWLQEFDLSVGLEGGLPKGRLDYVDYSVFKEDGKPGHLVVAPDVEGTAITTFLQISSACVEFTGVGKLVNTGEMLKFRAQACDNGEPGVGLDVFGIWIPERLLTHGTPYQRGPAMLSDGELIATLRSL